MAKDEASLTGGRVTRALLFLCLVGLAAGLIGVFQLSSPAKDLPKVSESKLPEQFDNYVGSEQCASCHQSQYQSWQRSHHAKSMLPASKSNVLADFSNVDVTHENVTASFSHRGDGFFVTTQGVDGEIAEYQVKYTFGFEPLQQYLVELSGGRLQALPWTWDTGKQRWYFLQPPQHPVPEADDWLHWTNGAMNWNSMCADCHSTNLIKNYQPESETYSTSWSEVNVGCEACHGPGRDHLAMMQDNPLSQSGELGLAVGKNLSPKVLVEQCGRCHARRGQLSTQFSHDSDLMMDHYLPELLRPGLYHGDGQILDEVFVYGSFTQSKMYLNGVSCNSCHDVHSGNLKAEGNQLCASCHDVAQYDSPQHHHHQESSSATKCITCHMPGKYYMGVDFRHDHSLRVPRPDLSVRYGVPNACNDCHQDRTARWAARAVTDWFGAKRQPHFSDTLASASADLGAALPQLIYLLEDRSQPAIARATALFWLAQAVNLPPVQAALVKAIKDDEPLLRYQAVTALQNLPEQERLMLFVPLLSDPVRAVRVAVAGALTGLSEAKVPAAKRDALANARSEQQQYMAQNADFSSGQGYIALQHEKRGEFEKAKKAYCRGLKIDNKNSMLRVNLANLHYSLQEYAKAELAFKKVIKYEPDFGPAYYSLGLLLAEFKRYKEAEYFLTQASQKMPENERVRKNLEAVRFYLNR